MSEREASIKLTLDNSQYIVNIRKAGDATDEAVKKSAKSASALGAGIHGAKKGIEELGGKAREAAKLVGGLAAAFSVEEGVKKIIGLRETFKDLEFQMTKNGKANVTWQGLMKDAQDIARETGQTTEKTAEGIGQIFTKTGDAHFAIEAMDSVGKTATASGKDVMQLANVAQILKRKFGADLSTLPDMMAVFTEKTDAGGASLDELGTKFALMAGEANEAGFKGTAGLSQLLGLVQSLDDRVGEKADPAMKKLFQTLKNGSTQLKELSKDAGIKFGPNEDAMGKIRKLLTTGRGRDALTAHLGGEARVVYDEIAKPFEEAFTQAKKSGKDTAKATEAGLAKFDAAMKEMAKTTLTADEVEKRAASRINDDPKIKLQQAMEQFEEAISTPEIFAAIDKLAADLPALATAISKVVGFAVHSPYMAGAAAIGIAGGGGFAKAAATQMVLNVGKSFSKQLETATAPVAKVMGDKISQSMAANPGLVSAGNVLGKVAGAAIALYAGYELGKVIADSIVNAKKDAQDTIVAANTAQAAGVSLSDKKAALAKAKETLSDLESGPSAGESLLGGLSTVGNKLGLVSDDDAKSATDSHYNDLKEAQKRVRELEANIKKVEDSARKKEEEKQKPQPQDPPGKSRSVKIDDYEPLARAIGRNVGLNLPKPAADTGNRGPLNPPAP